MKVLVTGANGFTGSHLSRRLVREGYAVRALVRRNANLAPLDGLPVEIAYGDLAEPGSLDTLLRGVGTVFHVAAAYRTEGVPLRVFRLVNADGTARLLEAALRAGVRRFVHCSTVGVQGWIRNPPATENAPCAPGDHYQASKLDGERVALEYFRGKGLPGVVVRPTAIYGPGDMRLLKLFKFIDEGRFRMIGDGRTLYHLVYVEDLVEGILLASQRDAALGEVVTIGGDAYLSLNDLVGKIASVLERPVPSRRVPVWPVWLAGLLCEVTCRPLGLEPPLYRRRVEFFVKDRAFDISKARRLLGYAPRVPLEEGLRRTAAWYRSQGLLSRRLGPEAATDVSEPRVAVPRLR